jgi:predicted PurR-regulated permease PerM
MPEGGTTAGPGGAARAFFTLGLFVLVAVLAYFGRGVLIPLIGAGFLSFIIYTLKETIRSGPLVGRRLPNWLCYMFAFAAIGSAFIFLVEIVRGNVEALIAAAPDYEARLRALTLDALAFIRSLGFVPEDFVGGVDELRQAALGMINPVLREVGASARAITANVVTIFLYTVFLLLERARIFRKIGLLSVEPAQKSAVNDTIGAIGATVRDYITIKTVMNLIVAAIGYAILRLVGIDFAGFWALLIFVLEFIPIVGAVIAVSAPAIFALVQPDGGVERALLTLVLLGATEQVMSSVVEPRLVGGTLNLSPLVILLSLAFWGSLWGFAGLLLAVPMTVTLMIVLAQFEETRAVAILLSDTGRIAEIRRPSDA